MKICETTHPYRLCLARAAPITAHQGDGSAYYVVTANKVTLADSVTLKIDPDGITNLSSNLGKMSDGTKPVVMKSMILWASTQTRSNHVE